MKTVMDRRAFLGLSATGALVAGAGLAGCAPRQGRQQDAAASDEEDAAGASDGGAQEAIPRVEGSSTKECDVCVVGAGAAGLMAALKLAEAGKSVIVVEKAHRHPCRTSRCAGVRPLARRSCRNRRARR